MKIIQTLLVLGTLAMVIACKKENKPSKMDIITSGTWKMIAHTAEPGYDYDGDGDVDTDIFSVTDECEKDDYFLFKRNGTLEVNEGATKCDPGTPQVFVIDWEFLYDEKGIAILTEEFQIDELTNSRMKLRQVYGGDTEILTFSKQ